MKKTTLLLLFFVQFCTGCSEFADIFNGTGNTFSPVVDANGTAMVFDYQSCAGAFNGMALQLLTIAGAYDGYNPKVDDAVAIVVNTSTLLEDMTVGEQVFKWPEIDFNQYSMVIGSCGIPYGGILAVKQRAVRKTDRIDYYIDLKSETGGIQTPTTCYFAALYPKLPDVKVHVHRHNKY